MNAIRINGRNRLILCEAAKIAKETIAITTYLLEKEFQHFINAQKNNGRNAMNKLLVVASHIVNLKKFGDIEKTKATKNANKSSFFTSLANKKVKKTLKTPSKIHKNKIIYSMFMPVICDRPDRKNGTALP